MDDWRIVLSHNLGHCFQADFDSVRYSKLLLKYFLAEGMVHRHALFFGSADPGDHNFLRHLPGITAQGPSRSDEIDAEHAAKPMKIAWRYTDSARQCHHASEANQGSDYHFNLQKVVSEEALASCQTNVWIPSTAETLSDASLYPDVFRSLHELQSEASFSPQPTASATKCLRRIAFHSVGSLSWGNAGPDGAKLTQFLLALRSLLRNSLGICFVTLSSSSITENGDMLARVRECVDFVVSLRCFDPRTKASPAFKDFHGFLHLTKTTGFNSLQAKVLEEKFVFRSTRTRFVVEKIHLPPELDEDSNEAETKPSPKTVAHMAHLEF